MTQALQVLQKYWKHNSFREPQEAIIQSVLEGNDTFALLPTGGGKSVCYQVPGMVLNGITLVISPLIALIKDQIENLQKKDIKAIGLVGALSIDEISDLLDNCLYGNYKFLYLSPERLQQDWIIERLKQLPINLIAIDEAHCVSQWGHDFRPAYLKIKLLKEFFPTIPFLALTGSATTLVQQDIIEHLGLENVAVFKKSFERENLSYHIIETEDKLTKISQILTKNPQSSIVYVRNRKATVDTCNQLNALGFKATFYHGGMSFQEKEKHRLLWMENKVQVIVATNAFGMGIDKPDVKTVIHLQIPENLENYYQEIGRAGRNGEKAFGILLTTQYDIELAKRLFEENIVTKNFLKDVYKKINNYFQIAYGEGYLQQFNFTIQKFCSSYNLPVLKSLNALQFLDRQGILTMENVSSEKVKVQFIIPSKEVIRYISLNTNVEPILTVILRTYSGIFDQEMPINLELIAKKSKTSIEQIVKVLQELHEKEIIDLQLLLNDSKIVFNEVREDDLTINRISKYLENQNKTKQDRFTEMISFIENQSTCKNKLLLRYFGEEITDDCGKCSTCLKKKKTDVKDVVSEILASLKKSPLNSRELESSLGFTSEEIIFAIQTLLEKNIISLNANHQYYIK
ncbi:RecQ family ATP-dependent DNA helicase [Flavobacterium haoranii]|uniref:ATP-dependent DNA helicase RecQ n=1 Tax=Flavobacterium haoranii TaxID=683124 RepID=A0A1M6BEH5_9FLAO|nr:ATP-dependent DNA helicase RecQ [Flavobacterium haoranii]SHI47119.1 ATP-dependent DNA helicase RecQ [Flavobacterium haoranii]